MFLELQEPFKSLWKKGYLRTSNLDNRRRVDLCNSKSNRTTISYARYLMCVKLGYVINSDFEVDHVDNNKSNDDVNNLQVVTSVENKLKETIRYLEEEQISYGYHCAFCNTPFILTEREQKMRLAKNQELAFCSRSCSAKYHNTISINSVIKYK